MALTAVFAGSSLAMQKANERETVLEELRAYYADFSERDWNKFSDHFWPDAILSTLWQPPGEKAERVWVTSVPDFVRQAPAGPGSKEVFEEKMTGADVRVQGNLAQVWARYEARFGDPGEIEKWSGIDSFLLLKHGGRWRIIALAYAPENQSDNE